MDDKFQTAFPDGPVKADPNFQSAFPDEQELQPGEVLCRYGCGRPGQYFGDGPRAGEAPRCAKQISDCPVAGGAAKRAAKKAGRLGRRW